MAASWRRGTAVLGLQILILGCTVSALPNFVRGRPKGGMLGRFIPTRPHSSLPGDQWFTQKLDHFNPQDTRVWSQRFFINDTFYKPGGPVFLMIGGEGTADPIWMVEGAWIDYAQQFNALCFQVEHRYYGKSHPTTNISTPNLQYLSSEQALADLANFRTQVSPDLQSNKWIAFGGSYPGSLAAWFRLKYPHLVDGAVASSAPIFAVADFSAYLAVVHDSLSFYNSQCDDAVQQATTTIENYIQTDDGRKVVQSVFKLCDPIDPTNSNDIANLYSTLAGNFEGVVQYNKDNRAFEGAVGTNISVESLCNMMTSTALTPFERYGMVNDLLLSTYSQKCVDYKYSSMIMSLQEVSWDSETAEGGRQWTYQTCTEFGYYQTSADESQPFGSSFPLPFWVQQCQDIFGASISVNVLNAGINFTNAYYGGRQLKPTKVIFPNGSIDPWHALGVVEDISPDATALYIVGTAHCANMYPSTPSDIPDLTAARVTISKTLSKWLQ